jgi:hypothetical protein
MGPNLHLMSQIHLQILKQAHRAVTKPRIFTAGIGILDWESFDVECRTEERGTGARRDFKRAPATSFDILRTDNGNRHCLAEFS